MRLLKPLFCQCIALVIVFVVANRLPNLHDPILFLALQSGLAMIFSYGLKQPTWWMPIHLLFLPCIFIFFSLALPSWWYFGIVSTLTLVYWGTIRGDVPLFLSSDEVAQAVLFFVQQEQAKTFADLGAGVGTVAIPVAKSDPEIKVDAWERAPLPWFFSFIRGRNLKNYMAVRGNFFTTNLSQYDIIFAFLSPAVMPEISQKIKTEMRSRSLFISSSFQIPDSQPESIKILNDFRKTVLYCYRID